MTSDTAAREPEVWCLGFSSEEAVRLTHRLLDLRERELALEQEKLYIKQEKLAEERTSRLNYWLAFGGWAILVLAVAGIFVFALAIGALH